MRRRGHSRAMFHPRPDRAQRPRAAAQTALGLRAREHQTPASNRGLKLSQASVNRLLTEGIYLSSTKEKQC